MELARRNTGDFFELSAETERVGVSELVSHLFNTEPLLGQHDFGVIDPSSDPVAMRAMTGHLSKHFSESFV